ncbi:MAG: sugar phosphate isomerase/epimerase [Chloroflexi bacterium]|nr:sugar phosphate isomerase/epimerase [Chloroflexota bacterium]
MYIGFSLPLDLVLGWLESRIQGPWEKAFRDIPEPLAFLHNLGIRYIELKLPVEATPVGVSTAYNHLRDVGFEVCYHLPSAHHFERERVRRTAKSYGQRISALTEAVIHSGGNPTVVVMHGYASPVLNKNVVHRRTIWVGRVLAHVLGRVGWTVSLELCAQQKGITRSGETYDEILYDVERVKSGLLHACWDWGNATANALLGLMPFTPRVEYLQRVVHVHAHDCRDGVTHLPLGSGSVPLAEYARALEVMGYQGAVILQLWPELMTQPAEFPRHVEESVSRLMDAIKQHSALSLPDSHSYLTQPAAR